MQLIDKFSRGDI